jgi:gamma-glutamylaminecyclotransferase
MSERVRLFVYGTLKRDQRAHHLLDGQEFLGPAETLPRYKMYNISWFPGLVEDLDEGDAIQGEIWSIDSETIQKLDEFEGELFERQEVLLANVFEPTETYIYLGRVPPQALTGVSWPLES